MLSFWILLLAALYTGPGLCSPASRARAPRARGITAAVSTFDYDPLMSPPSPKGLSSATLAALLARVPLEMRDQVREANEDSADDSQWMCMPLQGPPPDDCLAIIAELNNKTAANADNWYQVMPNYCWSMQSDNCRAFLCAEGDSPLMWQPGSIAQKLAQLQSNCGGVSTGPTSAWLSSRWWSTSSGASVYLTTF